MILLKLSGGAARANPTALPAVIFFTLLFALAGASQGLFADTSQRIQKIGANDVITVVIMAGGAKQHEFDLTVSEQGYINMIYVGKVYALGLSTSELDEKITAPLARDYFIDPEVHVTIKHYRSRQYYISGAVKAPGLFQAGGDLTILELIAKAGGLDSEHSNVAFVMRNPGGEVPAESDISADELVQASIRVDLGKLFVQGNMSENISLEPGDVVHIPFKASLDIARSKVYVEGQVETPGIYDYRPGLSALSAVLMAGGFTEYAAPNRTRIVRKEDGKDEIIRINLNQVQSGSREDVKLMPGDRVHVPETWF